MADAADLASRQPSSLADGSDRQWWLLRARWLAHFTIVYNLIEGLVSVGCGAYDESLALLGFGVDSFVETASAGLVLWRLRAESAGMVSGRSRERASSIGVSVLLVLLGLGTGVGSIWQLVRHVHPDTTVPGMIIAVVSLLFMFWLWRSKCRAAQALDSRTLRQDAQCSLGCIQLSVTLFLGSVLYLAVPALWWVDSAAALVIAGLILREGGLGLLAAWRGTGGGCGCSHSCS